MIPGGADAQPPSRTSPTGRAALGSEAKAPTAAKHQQPLQSTPVRVNRLQRILACVRHDQCCRPQRIPHRTVFRTDLITLYPTPHGIRHMHEWPTLLPSAQCVAAKPDVDHAKQAWVGRVRCRSRPPRPRPRPPRGPPARSAVHDANSQSCHTAGTQLNALSCVADHPPCNGLRCCKRARNAVRFGGGL